MQASLFPMEMKRLISLTLVSLPSPTHINHSTLLSTSHNLFILCVHLPPSKFQKANQHNTTTLYNNTLHTSTHSLSLIISVVSPFHCAKMFSKHLHLCFFKLKYPTILSQHHHNSSPSPPSTPNSTMFHFNTTFTHDYFASSSDSDSILELPPPDFASVFASQRFFFSSPGTSNSIIESSDDTRHNNNNNSNTTLIPRGGGVRVPKYSINPYVDFLGSMQEMIDSRQVLDVKKDWDYLHELLLCYLALNPTHTHKYIVRAFTDLVVDLLSSSSSSSLSSSSSSSSSSPPQPVVKTTPCRKYKCRRQCSFSGRLV